MTTTSRRAPERWILISGIFSLVIATGIQMWASAKLTPHPRIENAVEAVLILLKELGGVFIVGYLVQELIEIRHQRAWQRELQKRVRKTLRPAIREVRELNQDLGITLRNRVIIEDDDAREELTSKVLRPDFIRRNYRLTLTLQTIPASYVLRVTTETEYLLENVSRETKPWTIRGWIDTARDQWLYQFPKSRFVFLSFGKEEFREASSHRPVDLDPQTNKLLVLTEERDALTLAYPMDEPIHAGERYYIRLIAEQVMQIQDQFVWNMVHVTDKLDLVVKLRGSLDWNRFAVVPRLLHHQDHFIESSPQPANGECLWQLKNILLPYQGVQIWWWPLPSQAVLSAPEAGGNASQGA